MSTEMNLTDINLIRENSFDKLVLKLNYCGFYSIFLKLGFLPTIFEESRYSFPAEKYVDNNLLFFVFDEICSENKFISEFVEESLNNCTEVCVLNSLNQTHGCIPVRCILFLVDLDKFILNRKYRFCDFDFISNYTENKKIINSCTKECLFRSEAHYLEQTHQTMQSVNNEIILEVIPKKVSHFKYIETPKMSFDQLIYNCGGILGLWFGLSPKNLEFFKEKFPLINVCFNSIATKLILFFKNRKRDLIIFWKWVLNKE
jgi:hypothetical protein